MGTLLLAVATQAAPKADPQLILGGLPHLGYSLPAVVPSTHEVTYKTITPTVETNVVATGAAVPVAVEVTRLWLDPMETLLAPSMRFLLYLELLLSTLRLMRTARVPCPWVHPLSSPTLLENPL